MCKDSGKNRLRRFFNWLAAPAARNYTLGEVFRHYARDTPYDMIRDNRPGFTNAGRLTERLHMAAGVISAGLVLASLPLGMTTLGAAGGIVGVYKLMGLAGGKLADAAVSGRFYSRPAPPPRL